MRGLLRGLRRRLWRARLRGLWRGGLLRRLRWRRALLCRNPLRRRVRGPRADKNQNEEEEESSAAHSHEDTRINALGESSLGNFRWDMPQRQWLDRCVLVLRQRGRSVFLALHGMSA